MCPCFVSPAGGSRSVGSFGKALARRAPGLFIRWIVTVTGGMKEEDARKKK